MQFSTVPICPETTLLREARVSKTRGDRVIDELTSKGLIEPITTPTGRRIFTPTDAKVVFDVLVGNVALDAA